MTVPPSAVAALVNVVGFLAAVALYAMPRHRSLLIQVPEFVEAKKSHFMPRVFRRERLAVDDYAALPRFTFVDEATPIWRAGSRRGSGEPPS